MVEVTSYLSAKPASISSVRWLPTGKLSDRSANLPGLVVDYVVVGAGSAGCVVAEALSTRHSVTLLEAGGSDRTVEVAIPAAFSKLFKTERDWDFATEPEPGASSRSLYLPRGRMLGGSSSLNAMLYMRGRPSDYDGWAGGGAVGWEWQEVLPYFRTMESNSRGADTYHGDSGPLFVTDINRVHPLSRRFVEAAMATGIPPNRDFNGATQEGVGFFQVNQWRGRRWSAADAFLRPAMARPTLRVVTWALVIRLITDRGRVRGVEYVKNGAVASVEAEAEVILCAGSYGSPQILQISGIGDPEHLRSIGVDPIVESPGVGQNLQDHPAVAVIYDSLTGDSLDDAENLFELARWLTARTGRLTSPVAEACAFVRSSPEVDEPDLQFHFAPVNFDNHGLEPYDGHAFTLGPVLINPESRGRVRARSADPTTPPAIEVNVLASPRDMEAMVRGVGIAREIVAQAPFDTHRGEEIKPGPGVTSSQDLETYLRENVELLYHPVGTCRMGSGEEAVVDSELSVRGIEGLRVADASVMPKVVSGNTNAPTMMIAARAADFILSQ